MKNNKFKSPTRKAYSNEKRSAGAESFSKGKAPSGALKYKSQPAEKIDISRIIERTGKAYSGKLPELLAPAGSLASLKAAIAAGADAVYFGGGDFNARINATNFTNEEIIEAINLLHSAGRRAYITLNTLTHTRELDSYLRFAEFLYKAGADALIVADLGGAAAIHRHLPDFELHASTQMSGHNLDQAKLLANCGFSRMVCARELPKDDIEYLVKNSPIEIEMFVHGALCVCHSGQCLFSSLVGGRSGNRGACAQPCRLPYTNESGEQSYALSLKDLSLANHVTELIEIGVHSLKIEGRMKSPEYVFGVVKAFRALLDERKNATQAEMNALAKIFSRDGFTDAYYERKIGKSMLGVRSDEQKLATKLELTSSARMDEIVPVKKKIEMCAHFHLNEPITLTLDCDGVRVTAKGQACEIAKNAPLSKADIRKNLLKLGSTDFECVKDEIFADENIIVPISAINALRRSACEMLQNELDNRTLAGVGFDEYVPLAPKGEKRTIKSARFVSPKQITDSAREFFDIIYLPLQNFGGECDGVILPPVILDSERENVEKMLAKAKNLGAKYALCGNLGALEMARAQQFKIHGDFRFNVYNGEGVAFLEQLGVENILLSPELTLPQMRDISGDTTAVVYGRIPLMLLEKCVNNDTSNCASCTAGKSTITDRRGVSFPVLRELDHRNVIYNSMSTYMADKTDDLSKNKITNWHFIFSVEDENEVDSTILAYQNGLPPKENSKIRRI